jgi:hypothetical protein
VEVGGLFFFSFFERALLNSWGEAGGVLIPVLAKARQTTLITL